MCAIQILKSLNHYQFASKARGFRLTFLKSFFVLKKGWGTRRWHVQPNSSDTNIKVCFSCPVDAGRKENCTVVLSLQWGFFLVNLHFRGYCLP